MRVFISYRHDDVADLAGRLADRLRVRSDFEAVFLDVDVIAYGADFAASIKSALNSRPACIVIIGPRWLGQCENNLPRIFDPEDWVRLEVAAMLEADLQVIPILAGGTEMPKAAALPGALHRLTTLNALRIRHESFQSDMDTLAMALLGRPPRKRSALRALIGACCGLVAGLVGTVVIAYVHATSTGMALNDRIGDGTTSLLLILLPLGAIVAGIWLSARPIRMRLLKRSSQ